MQVEPKSRPFPTFTDFQAHVSNTCSMQVSIRSSGDEDQSLLAASRASDDELEAIYETIRAGARAFLWAEVCSHTACIFVKLAWARLHIPCQCICLRHFRQPQCIKLFVICFLILAVQDLLHLHRGIRPHNFLARLTHEGRQRRNMVRIPILVIYRVQSISFRLGVTHLMSLDCFLTCTRMQELRPGRPYRWHFRRRRSYLDHGRFYRHDGCRCDSSPHSALICQSICFVHSGSYMNQALCISVSNKKISNSVLERANHRLRQEGWRAWLDRCFQHRLPVRLVLDFPHISDILMKSVVLYTKLMRGERLLHLHTMYTNIYTHIRIQCWRCHGFLSLRNLPDDSLHHVLAVQVPLHHRGQRQDLHQLQDALRVHCWYVLFMLCRYMHLERGTVCVCMLDTITLLDALRVHCW
jgi:hypothetical protein